MMQPKELQQLGEKLAKDYLEHGVSLNDGLEKAAALHGLNRNQLHRVAEVANVKTHLDMLKTASDNNGYVEFDVADPSKIQSVVKTKQASYVDDYERAPARRSTPEINIFQKTASAEPQEEKKDVALLYKQAAQKKAQIDKLANECLEASMRLENKLPIIYSQVKQAALNGTSLTSLSYLIKEAAPLGEYVREYINEDLKKDGLSLPDSGFEKFAGRRINPDNELFERIVDFNNEANEALKTASLLKEKLSELGDDHAIEKLARRQGVIGFTGRQIKGLINFARNNKAVSAGAGLYTVGRVQGSNTVKREPVLVSNLIEKNPKHRV